MSIPEGLTCLFTDEELPPTTREEHTIPRALGGRIRSRVTSSSAFNEKCGQVVDAHLKAAYSATLNKLSVLMSSEHSAGKLAVDIPGEQKGIVLQPGGAAIRSNVVVEHDAITGLPISAMASDPKPLRKLARQLGKESSAKYSAANTTDATTFFYNAPVILPELEVAACKCALLSFDHCLRNSSNRFTRVDELRGLRESIRSQIMTGKVDGPSLNRYSLGLQYENLEWYRQIRDQVEVPRSEFEHVLIAASHAPSKCLDMVWLVLGFDPFGFRLSNNWTGPDISFAVVSGVLRNEISHEPVTFVPFDRPLCMPTYRRSFPSCLPSKDQQKDILDEIAFHRNEAYGRAVLLVELQADEFVKECMMESATLATGDDRTMLTLVKNRLMRMYGRMQKDGGFVADVDAIVSDQVKLLSTEVRSQGVEFIELASPVNWSEWIELYRRCLSKLKGTHGLPGDIFVEGVDSRLRRTDSRRLGDG